MVNTTIHDEPAAATESGARPNHPVLIVNPKSGDGRAAAIDLVSTAERLGVETVTMHPGDDLAALADTMVDRGHDHLMMAGGDGSLAIVAEVAMARSVAFSCVPVGTRNHFAMDLGLDRNDPLRSLAAAHTGMERLVDVGMIVGQVFVNNVSFGVYAQAIADPDYRSHRTRSMADAAVTTARQPEIGLVVHLPDGRSADEIEVLLVSNNPYRFIGPPDFARRPSLESGTLGIILSDRRSRLRRGPAAVTRRESPSLIVHADSAEIWAGVDGELKKFEAPTEITIVPKALRVIVPKVTQPKSLKESIDQLNESAIIHLSGLPTLPSRDEITAKSPLTRRLHEADVELFERVAGWESPTMDRVLPSLSEAASHSKIWMAVAFIMSVVGGNKGRRTAAMGLVAVGITSFLANLVAKSLFRRPRPTDPVPEARSLPNPGSSSMPSGHTASGAAFARVVGAAYPRLRVPLDGLVAAIGFSRVYTGVHYPSDVAAGWLLGRGVGAMTSGVVAIARMARRRAARPRIELGPPS